MATAHCLQLFKCAHIYHSATTRDAAKRFLWFHVACIHKEIWDKIVTLEKGIVMFLVPLVYNNYSLYVPHFQSCTNILKFLPVWNSCAWVIWEGWLCLVTESVTQPPSAWSHYVCLMQQISSATLSSSVLNFCCNPFAGDRLKSWNIGNCL